MTVDWKKAPSTVLIRGKESFLKDRELDIARKSLPTHDYLEYDASEGVQAIDNALYTQGFFSSSKVIVVRNLDKAKDHKDLFLTYCKKPQPDKTLILVTEDKKSSAKWIRNLPVGFSINHEEIASWKIPDWLVEEALRMGLDLSKGFAEAIVMNVGEDLYSLSNELDKIKVYCGERSVVQVSDIEAVLFQHTAFSPFEVVRLWGLKEGPQAVRFFLKHLDNTPRSEWVRSELVVLNTLLNRVERLLMAKELSLSGKGDHDISKRLGVSHWVYKNRVKSQLQSRTIPELETAYLELCRVEVDVKRGVSGKLLLEKFLLQF